MYFSSFLAYLVNLRYLTNNKISDATLTRILASKTKAEFSEALI